MGSFLCSQCSAMHLPTLPFTLVTWYMCITTILFYRPASPVHSSYSSSSLYPSLDASASSSSASSTTSTSSESAGGVSAAVTAVEGSKAMLPCFVDVPANDSVDLILWFRGDGESALYSVDARAGRAKHFPSDELSARAFIDITSRPTSLVLESTRSDDAGHYKCRMDFRRGRTQYRTVTLTVVVPPKQVIIMNEAGELLASSNILRSGKAEAVGPFNERAHLTVVCEAEGGYPTPTLRWLKDGLTIDESWTVTPQGIVRNELVITRLRRGDLMSTLVCEASNSNLTEAISTAISLELNLRPLDVKITSSRRSLSSGKRVQISCESSGSRPPAVVTWWLGSKQLLHVTEEISANQNTTISTLHFTPSATDQARILACRADHAILPDSALEDSWLLDVYFRPVLTLNIEGGSSKAVHEGTNVTLTCNVQANPLVTHVSWSLDGRSLTGSEAGELIIGNFTLTLPLVKKELGGKFRCSASNVEGEGVSSEAHLKVLYAPVCSAEQKTLYGVATREPVQVPCDVNADPPQVSFHWTLNNTLKILPIKSFVSSHLRSVATYAPRSKFGYGQLYCWSSNSVGTQREPCVFNIIPAGPPQPVHNCIVGNQSTESFIVKCEPGEDGGLEQSFHLEIYFSGGGFLHANLSSLAAPVFDVTSLPMSTSFVLVLYAANSKGRSNSVALSTSTLPFPTNKEETPVTPLAAIFIGVAASLVLTVTLLTLLARLRRGKVKKDSGKRPNPLGDSSRRLNNDDSSSSPPNHGHILDPFSTDQADKEMLYDVTRTVHDPWARSENNYFATCKKSMRISITACDQELAVPMQKELARDLPIEVTSEYEADGHSSHQPQLQYAHKHHQSNPRYMLSKAAIMRDSAVVLLNEDVVSIDASVSNTTALSDCPTFIPPTAFSPSLALTSSTLTERTRKKVATLSTPV